MSRRTASAKVGSLRDPTSQCWLGSPPFSADCPGGPPKLYAKAEAGPLRLLLMTKVLCTLGLVLFSASSASATWSVIALDRMSFTVAIASATCVAQDRFERFPAKGLMDIQAIVVPGKGIAAAQAGVDRSRQNQTLIFQRS